MSQKPNVLIFGGCNSLGPQIALFLAPLHGETLVSHIRMVDKFSMFPPTTYVVKDFITLLDQRKDVVEYRQANLTVPAAVAKSFEPAPDGRPYTHVFDLTGEYAFDRPADVQISKTFKVSLALASEAAKQKTVKSYIRSVPISTCYNQAVTDKKGFTEDDANGWVPLGVRGVWWHEMLRAVASIPDLPLVILRTAYKYGPGEVRSEVTTSILLGLVYSHLGEDMKLLWSPKLKKSTVHTQDVVGAAWATAQWAAELQRPALDAAAGVSLKPTGDSHVKTVAEAVQREHGSVVAPVFNLVDEGDSDQQSIASTVGQVFGIKTGFTGTISNMYAKLTFNQFVEDVNEHHMNEWSQIIGTVAEPPVISTPLSPYALPFELENHGCAYNGDKLRKIVGYHYKHPRFDVDTVKGTIESYRTEGIWPETKKYPIS